MKILAVILSLLITNKIPTVSPIIIGEAAVHVGLTPLPGRQISCTSLTADILLYQPAVTVSSPELLPDLVLASAPNWLSY